MNAKSTPPGLETLAEHEHAPGATSLGPAAPDAITETTSTSAIAKELLSQCSGDVEAEATFTMFPKLPIELRLNIWKLALPGPRIIEVFHQYDVVEELSETGGDDGDGATDKAETENEEWVGCDEPIIDTIYTKTPPPALLHVCKESREVAQEKYCVPLSTNNSVGHVWFDPEEDIIFIPYSDTLPQDKLLSTEGLCMGVLLDIRHLAVDLRMIDEVLFGNIPGLANLDELTFVLHNSCEDGWKKKGNDIKLFQGGEYIAEDLVYDRGIPESLMEDFAIAHEVWPFYVKPLYSLRCMKRGGENCTCYEKYAREDDFEG